MEQEKPVKKSNMRNGNLPKLSSTKALGDGYKGDGHVMTMANLLEAVKEAKMN